MYNLPARFALGPLFGALVMLALALAFHTRERYVDTLVIVIEQPPPSHFHWLRKLKRYRA